MNEATIFKSETGRTAILTAYDDMLNAWPVPLRRHTLQTRQGETFALDCGPQDAPALVLLHGSMANSAMWIGDAYAYSQHFRMIALDFPGEPGMSQPLRMSLENNEPVDWLADVLDALGLEKVILGGISLGGGLALSFATACPRRVEKLVLLCPDGLVQANTAFLLKTMPLILLGRRGTGMVMKYLNGGKALDDHTLAFSHLINANFSPRRSGFPVLGDDRLRGLTMPVLLVVGEADPLIDPSSSVERLRHLLPDLQVVMAPGEGHILANKAGTILPFLLETGRA